LGLWLAACKWKFELRVCLVYIVGSKVQKPSVVVVVVFFLFFVIFICPCAMYMNQFNGQRAWRDVGP
jgi:hypothetical protein